MRKERQSWVFAFYVAVGAVALCFVGCGYGGSGAILCLICSRSSRWFCYSEANRQVSFGLVSSLSTVWQDGFGHASGNVECVELL